jgi:DNA-directed RNA polymerase specialized sigma24 family protein
MYAKRKKDDEECSAGEYIMDSDVLNTMSENSADGRAFHSDLKECIDEEVASMSDKRRRIACMMSMGYSAKEIAEAEGCSCNAVYKCVWDIRDALKKALSEWCDDSGRVAC